MPGLGAVMTGCAGSLIREAQIAPVKLAYLQAMEASAAFNVALGRIALAVLPKSG
jgi:hypothetical protein